MRVKIFQYKYMIVDLQLGFNVMPHWHAAWTHYSFGRNTEVTSPINLGRNYNWNICNHFMTHWHCAWTHSSFIRNIALIFLIDSGINKNWYCCNHWICLTYQNRMDMCWRTSVLNIYWVLYPYQKITLSAYPEQYCNIIGNKPIK